MASAKTNYFIDMGLGISFLLVGITGIIKFPGFLKSLGLAYSNLPMRQISLIHDWAGIIMILLVIVHLILHFKWIVLMTKSFFRREDKI
jgi:cytochrome b subunit of formate dehydrogenase